VRLPVLGLGHPGDVELTPVRVGHAAARTARIAGNRDDLLAGLDEPGDNRSADQSGRPGHEHAHALC
jgi:hypothetical protein